MAKRYGRNQRRAHIHEITRLREELEQAQLAKFGILGLCDDESIMELPMSAITRMDERSVTEPGYLYDHEITVELTGSDGRVNDAIWDISQRGEFRLGGIRYIIKGVTKEHEGSGIDDRAWHAFLTPSFRFEAVGVRGNKFAKEFDDDHKRARNPRQRYLRDFG